MRIKFNSDEARDHFFNTIKEKYRGNLKALFDKLSISRKIFWAYSSGRTTISKETFDKLLNFLPESERKKLRKETIEVSDNWGKVIGGKNAYKANCEEFRKGRIKGLNLLTKRIRKANEYVCPDYEISQKLCEFIGAFIGDGCFNCYKNKLYHIEFSGDSRMDLNYYKSNIIPTITSIMPELNPHIYFVKDSNTIRTVFYSKRLFHFIKNEFGFIPGPKTYTVGIPEKILSSDKKFIYATIRGIADTDGTVYIDKRKSYKTGYPRISITTKSKNLHDQLVKILTQEFKIYDFFNKSREAYVVEIYGSPQLKKWMSLIGFSNDRHLEKVKISPV